MLGTHLYQFQRVHSFSGEAEEVAAPLREQLQRRSANDFVSHLMLFLIFFIVMLPVHAV
jgi:hypothetical protein